MVRRNELACRDEWSRSLWQPREEPHSNGDQPFQRRTPGPLPPTLAENLRSVLNHDMALAASAEGEDVLLSEARIVSETHESWEPPPRPFPVGNFDPRTAIFRAREAYRERVRAKTAADRHSAGVEAATGFATAEVIAPDSMEDAKPEPGDSVPHEADAVIAAGANPVPAAEVESWPGDSVGADIVAPEPAIPVSGATSGEGAYVSNGLTASDSYLGESPEERLVPATRHDQSVMPAHRTQSIDDVGSAKRRAEGSVTEAFPDWYRADLPRICRTCRDYRPSTDGQRGWCANAWAFTHRRLVLEDDPAPCQSAIGDWWLPVDDVWLVAADVSSHGRATPLLDRLAAKAEQQRRRS